MIVKCQNTEYKEKLGLLNSKRTDTKTPVLQPKKKNLC